MAGCMKRRHLSFALKTWGGTDISSFGFQEDYSLTSMKIGLEGISLEAERPDCGLAKVGTNLFIAVIMESGK